MLGLSVGALAVYFERFIVEVFAVLLQNLVAFRLAVQDCNLEQPAHGLTHRFVRNQTLI